MDNSIKSCKGTGKSSSHLRPSEQPLLEERTNAQDVGGDDAEADD